MGFKEFSWAVGVWEDYLQVAREALLAETRFVRFIRTSWASGLCSVLPVAPWGILVK